MNLSKHLLAITLVSLTSGAAFAHDSKGEGHGHHKGPRHGGAMMVLENFDAVDANKDGKVTAEEITASGSARFAEADKDKDGALSVEEVAAMHIKRSTEMAADRATKLIKAKDANGDGKLSEEEMKPKEADPSKLIEKVDTDGDGAISKEEAEETRSWMEKARAWFGKGQGGTDE